MFRYSILSLLYDISLIPSVLSIRYYFRSREITRYVSRILLQICGHVRNSLSLREPLGQQLRQQDLVKRELDLITGEMEDPADMVVMGRAANQPEWLDIVRPL